MGEVVNLNQYRKRRQRSKSQKRAAGSRAKGGGGGERETRVDHEAGRVNGDFEDKQPDKSSPPEDTPSAN